MRVFYFILNALKFKNLKNIEKSTILLNTYETQTFQFLVFLPFHKIVCKLKAIKLYLHLQREGLLYQCNINPFTVFGMAVFRVLLFFKSVFDNIIKIR